MIRAPYIAAACALAIGACSPRFEFNAAGWQPYFAQVRAGNHPSICDNAARQQPGRLAIVLTETGEGHMVAVERDGWVNDNRLPGGAYWWQLPYRWIAEERTTP